MGGFEEAALSIERRAGLGRSRIDRPIGIVFSRLPEVDSLSPLERFVSIREFAAAPAAALCCSYPSLPAKSVAELIAHAQADPGKINCAARRRHPVKRKSSLDQLAARPVATASAVRHSSFPEFPRDHSD